MVCIGCRSEEKINGKLTEIQKNYIITKYTKLRLFLMNFSNEYIKNM